MKIVIIAVAGIFAFGPQAEAQTATAFKTGERTSGMTKQCYYEFAGSEYIRTVQSYELCPLSIRISTAGAKSEPSETPKYEASTVTALKTGERKSGMTKQCFYEFAGAEYTKTVQSYELCPLSIKIRR